MTWKTLNPEVIRWKVPQSSFDMKAVVLGAYDWRLKTGKRRRIEPGVLLCTFDESDPEGYPPHTVLWASVRDELAGLERLAPRMRNAQRIRLWVVHLTRCEAGAPIVTAGRLVHPTQVKALIGTVVPPVMPRIVDHLSAPVTAPAVDKPPEPK